jgi:hypothetical protein
MKEHLLLKVVGHAQGVGVVLLPANITCTACKIRLVISEKALVICIFPTCYIVSEETHVEAFFAPQFLHFGVCLGYEVWHVTLPWEGNCLPS